jgi:hypothetical protein
MECSNYMIDLAPKKQTTSQLTSALLEGKQLPSRPSVVSASRASNLNLAVVENPSPTSNMGTISPALPGSPPPELASDPSRDSQNASNPGTNIPSPTGPTGPSAAGAETSTVTYLNVHSGVGVGVMAGIDVGANNRWEYLLLGQPLSDVAVAESLANKGELVISPEAHALLCGVPVAGPADIALPAYMMKSPSRKSSIPSTIREDSPLTVPAGSDTETGAGTGTGTGTGGGRVCQCVRCAESEGFWRVDPTIPLVPAVNAESPEDLADYDLYFYSEIMERTTVAYREVVHQIDDLMFAKVRLEIVWPVVTVQQVLRGTYDHNPATYACIHHASYSYPGMRCFLQNKAAGTLVGNGIANSISLTSLPTFALTSPRDRALNTTASARTGPTTTSTRTSAHSSAALLSERMGHAPSTASSSVDMSASGASLDYSVSPRLQSASTLSNRASLDLSDCTGVKQIETINEEDPASAHPSGAAFEILAPTAAEGAVKTAIVTKCSAEVTEVLFGHYLSWVQQCLLDDFAMHVHEADRTDFEFRGASRRGALDKFIRTHFAQPINSQFSTASLPGMALAQSSTPHAGGQVLSTSSSAATISATSNSNLSLQNMNTPNRRASNFRGSLSTPATSSREPTSFVQKMRTLNTTHMTLKEQNKNKNRRIRNQDTSLNAELRNVIVLFISLQLESASLVTSDPTTPASDKAGRFSEKLSEKASAKCYSHHAGNVSSRIKGFHFLTRTEEEFNDDQRIMNSFQDCMEVITKIFKANGGQMRQFIVDDKGTLRTVR